MVFRVLSDTKGTQVGSLVGSLIEPFSERLEQNLVILLKQLLQYCLWLFGHMLNGFEQLAVRCLHVR